MWNKILYVYGDNFGRVTVTRLGSYVVLQKVKHHKKPNQAEGSIMNKINNYFWSDSKSSNSCYAKNR
jgi:hypothetical protein